MGKRQTAGNQGGGGRSRRGSVTTPTGVGKSGPRLSTTEIILLLIATALGVASLPGSDPWIVFPMLLISDLAFLWLFIIHSGSWMWRAAGAVLVTCVLGTVGGRLYLDSFPDLPPDITVLLRGGMLIHLVYADVKKQDGSSGCLKQTPQMYLVGLRNNSTHYIGIDSLIVEATLKDQKIWKVAKIVVPADNMYWAIPVTEESPRTSLRPPEGYLLKKFVTKTLMAQLENSIPPGGEVYGTIISEPIGSVPEVGNLLTPTETIGAIRVTVKDGKGRHYVGVEDDALTSNTMLLGEVGVPKGFSWSFVPVGEDIEYKIRRLPLCKANAN